MPPTILAFAGSTRTESWNKKLVRIAAEGARKAGGDVTTIDLRDFPMPLYDEDLEVNEGFPEAAKRLKTLFLQHQGLLVASPEYNSSISGVLKNTIDWVSRSAPGETPLACFSSKVAALMSASPGTLGGLRGLVAVRAVLNTLHVLVLPQQLSISRAHDAFNPNGSLKDPAQQGTAEQLGQELTLLLRKLHG